jgi:hypothetical protein
MKIILKCLSHYKNQINRKRALLPQATLYIIIRLEHFSKKGFSKPNLNGAWVNLPRKIYVYGFIMF